MIMPAKVRCQKKDPGKMSVSKNWSTEREKTKRRRSFFARRKFSSFFGPGNLLGGKLREKVSSSFICRRGRGKICYSGEVEYSREKWLENLYARPNLSKKKIKKIEMKQSFFLEILLGKLKLDIILSNWKTLENFSPHGHRKSK